MNAKSIISNASVAFLAQGIAMVLSLVQSLVIPKMLGISEYGYWQLFLFYSSYVGFFHFGLNDGVYLIEGGHTRSQIDRRSVSSQFSLSASVELLLTLLLFLFALLGPIEHSRAFAVGATGLFLLLKNTADYCSFVLQAMNETKTASYSMIIERLFFIVAIIVLIVSGVGSFEPYVVAYVLACLTRLCYCLVNLRDFVADGFYPFSRTVSMAFESVRVGIKLMMANIASQLIIGIARVAIDASWGIGVFGELSLALSLVTFFLSFVQQASMVLFPALRQSSEKEVRSFFGVARDAMCLFFPVAYAFYCPISFALNAWLPTFAGSFVFFAYLMPICVFESKMDIVCTTYFKVARQEKTLLLINVATLALSSLGTLFSVFMLRSLDAVIMSAVCAIAIRSLFSEALIARKICHPLDRLTLWELLLTAVFLITTLAMPKLAAWGCYVIFLALFYVIHRKRIFSLAKRLSSITKS